MLMFDPIGLMIGVVGMAMVGYAQLRVRSAYRKWSEVGARSGMTGAEVAKRMMYDENIDDVKLECIDGEMTDHYDPTAKVVRLSHGVYHGNSIAALGIAAHEVGHVIQHAHAYAPMQLRSLMYPVSAIGSQFGIYLVMAGIFLSQSSFGPTLATVGLWMFAAGVAFAIVTLPVEFDASRRAKLALEHGGMLSAEEMKGCRSVLGAAAMTYVAGAAVAVMQLVHLLMIVGGLRRSDDA